MCHPAGGFGSRSGDGSNVNDRMGVEEGKLEEDGGMVLVGWLDDTVDLQVEEGFG
jgi:hypothetical protein